MRSDEDEVHALLRHLDHPMPRVDVRDVMQRAQPRRWSDVGRAAGILMMLGVAGAAWAAPGSPVSGWIAKVVARVGRPSTIKAVTAVQAIAPVAIPAVSASAKPRMSGVAVAPGAKLAISFTASQPVGELRISLSSVADVSVRTADPAATFTSSDGQLRVSNAGSQASFDLEVPVSAVRVEIFVDGHLRYVKDHRRITSASASRRGALYVIPLQPLSWINP